MRDMGKAEISLKSISITQEGFYNDYNVREARTDLGKFKKFFFTGLKACAFE